MKTIFEWFREQHLRREHQSTLVKCSVCRAPICLSTAAVGGEFVCSGVCREVAEWATSDTGSRGFETDRRRAAVELLLGAGYKWNGKEWLLRSADGGLTAREIAQRIERGERWAVADPLPGSRRQFEAWYVENAFDYESNPIGCRDCGLMWKAWSAAVSMFQPAGYEYRFMRYPKTCFGREGWSGWSPISKEDYERELAAPTAGRQIRVLYAVEATK